MVTGEAAELISNKAHLTMLLKDASHQLNKIIK